MDACAGTWVGLGLLSAHLSRGLLLLAGARLGWLLELLAGTERNEGHANRDRGRIKQHLAEANDLGMHRFERRLINCISHSQAAAVTEEGTWSPLRAKARTKMAAELGLAIELQLDLELDLFDGCINLERGSQIGGWVLRVALLPVGEELRDQAGAVELAVALLAGAEGADEDAPAGRVTSFEVWCWRMGEAGGSAGDCGIGVRRTHIGGAHGLGW